MIKWKENARMLFYVERSIHADLDFTALRGEYCSCKKPKKENKCCCLLILNPSSSLHRSVIPAQSYRPEKNEYLQQLWMKPNILPTAAAWKLQTTWNIQQTFLPDRNKAVDASDNK